MSLQNQKKKQQPKNKKKNYQKKKKKTFLLCSWAHKFFFNIGILTVWGWPVDLSDYWSIGLGLGAICPGFVGSFFFEFFFGEDGTF
jgi:hypothetical protein